MAVRFMPVHPDPASAPVIKGELAKVVDIRSKLIAGFEDSDLVAEQPAEPKLQDIMVFATKLLARKAMTSGELERALLKLGYPAAEVENVIADFQTRLYLDDHGVALALMEKLRRSKNYSKIQIHNALRRKHLEDDIILEVLSELDAEEERSLLNETALARATKMSGLPRATAERRLLGFLARRGWIGGEAFQAARDALDAANI